MDCTTARAAVSALLDGEPVDNLTTVTAHLSGCVDCRSWRAAARDLVSAAAAEFAAVPDLTVSVLEAVAADRTARERAAAAARRSRRRVLRVAVGVAAVAQLVLAVPALLAVTGITDGAMVHLSREMASFDIAVAVGFLLAALRPERARAFVPVALVLAGCLAVTSGVDLVSGATGPADEAGHLAALVQSVLLWFLGRDDRPDRRVIATATADRTG